MNALAILWIAICLLGLAVSLKSAAVLRRRSLWTLAGWLATAAYFAIAGIDAARGSRAVAHLDYVTLRGGGHPRRTAGGAVVVAARHRTDRRRAARTESALDGKCPRATAQSVNQTAFLSIAM